MGWRRYLPRLMGPEGHSTLDICFVFCVTIDEARVLYNMYSTGVLLAVGPEDTLFVVLLGTMQPRRQTSHDRNHPHGLSSSSCSVLSST